MIHIDQKGREQLAELGANIADIFTKLEGLGVPESLRQNIGVHACRVQALANSEEIIAALYTVEDGHTPEPEQIEQLRTGLYYADLLKIDEGRIRAALAAGAERRLAGS